MQSNKILLIMFTIITMTVSCKESGKVAKVKVTPESFITSDYDKQTVFVASDLNGTWLDPYVYSGNVSEPYHDFDSYEYSWGKGTIRVHSIFSVDLNSKNVKIVTPDDGGFKINEIKQLDDNSFCFYVYQEYEGSKWELTFTFHFINKDVIWIEYTNIADGGDGYGIYSEGEWHRLSGPAVIEPQNAVVNDSRVRLRVKPNLKSDVWFFLNTGEKVTIIDKTSEKEKVGKVEDYWYKVQTNHTPDGWVFGEFLTIEK